MTNSDYTALLAQLDRFNTLLRANRAASDTELARQMHDNTIAILDDLRANCADAIDHAASIAREADAEKRRELARRLRQYEWAIASHWNEPEPYMLGGWQRIDGDTFINPVTERTETIGDAVMFQPIPDDRLCGLPAILDALVAETGVTFDRVIAFWKAMPANGQRTGELCNPDGFILF